MNDEQLGRLLEKVDQLVEDQKKVFERLDQIEDKIKTYTVIVKTVRFLAGVVIAILSLKFGNLSIVWKQFLS